MTDTDRIGAWFMFIVILISILIMAFELYKIERMLGINP